MSGRQFVLTSVNAAHAREVVGASEMAYEIVGKPVELDEIARAIKEASKRRSTSCGYGDSSISH